MRYTFDGYMRWIGWALLGAGAVALGYLIGVHDTTEVWANVRDRYYTKRTDD